MIIIIIIIILVTNFYLLTLNFCQLEKALKSNFVIVADVP